MTGFNPCTGGASPLYDDGFAVCSGAPVVITPAAVIQSTPVTEITAASTILITPVTTAGGNLNLVVVAIRAIGVTPSSVIDSAGNTYSLLFSVANSSTAALAVYATNQAAPLALAAGTITITVSGPSILAARFWEISGANNTSPLDPATASASSGGVTSATPSSGTSGSFANAGELIFGAIANDYGSAPRTFSAFTFSTGVPTTSWLTATTGDNSSGTGSAGLQLHSGALAPGVASGQAISETISSASQWAAAVWAIRSAGH